MKPVLYLQQPNIIAAQPPILFQPYFLSKRNGSHFSRGDVSTGSQVPGGSEQHTPFFLSPFAECDCPKTPHVLLSFSLKFCFSICDTVAVTYNSSARFTPSLLPEDVPTLITVTALPFWTVSSSFFFLAYKSNGRHVTLCRTIYNVAYFNHNTWTVLSTRWEDKNSWWCNQGTEYLTCNFSFRYYQFCFLSKYGLSMTHTCIWRLTFF